MGHIQIFNILIASVLSLLAPGDDPPALVTAADVESAISRLEDREARPAALEQLINVGSLINRMNGRDPSTIVGGSGDPVWDAMLNKAEKAVEESRDLATVRMALESSRPTLQSWALSGYPVEVEKRDEGWRALVPRIRDLARVGMVDVRRRAQEVLRSSEDQAEFLARCAETETDLSNIKRLVRRSTGAGFQDLMRPHVLRVLRDPDEKVRRDALLAIGAQFNPSYAKMLRLDFTDEEFRRVLELSRSRSDKERELAVFALAEMRQVDPAALRARMIELADDPTEDVRWRIPGVLSGQKQRADVKALLARLLRDGSAIVRYCTIQELGPRDHVPELREMAAGKDAKWAKEAADKLKQLGLAPPADRVPRPPMTREVPVDYFTMRDIGLSKQTCEIDVPEGMKLALLYRVYREGKLDPKHTSEQVAGNTIKPWIQRVSLGSLDPDALTPEPSKKLKIFGDGSINTIWVDVPEGYSKGGSIGGHLPEVMEPGKEYELLSLAAVMPPAHTSMIDMGMMRSKALIRVTIGARIDPLTEEDRRSLSEHSNFHRAFPLEK